ncbi:MAG: antibiotic biosynthesis monooxygenase [Pseudomonadota bacterium]
MKYQQAVLRVFQARPKAGKAQQLKDKFAQTSVSVVVGEPGNLGYLFGTDISSDQDELVFISLWESLNAVKQRFGDNWQASFLPEGYDDLIERCTVRHIEFDGELPLLQE